MELGISEEKWHGPLGKKSFITIHERKISSEIPLHQRYEPLLLSLKLATQGLQQQSIISTILNLGTNHYHISSCTKYPHNGPILQQGGKAGIAVTLPQFVLQNPHCFIPSP